LKVRYKCRIFANGKEIKSTDFAMGSRQDNHDIDIATSQIK